MGVIKKLINDEWLTEETLLVRHKGLVHRECNQFTALGEKFGYSYEDLAQVGFMGLLKAFRRFDSEKFPVRFSTYAVPMISGEVSRMIRDSNAGVKYTRAIKTLGRQIRRADLEGKQLSVIAAELEVTEDKIVSALDYLRNERTWSLDKPLAVSENEPLTAKDLIGVSDDMTELFVEDFIKSLSKREQIIVRDLMASKTQGSIGLKLGVTQVQVSRIQKVIGLKYLEFAELDKPKNERTPRLSEKNNFTESEFNMLRAKGMTYKRIAEELGVTLTLLHSRRRKWRTEKSQEPREAITQLFGS